MKMASRKMIKALILLGLLSYFSCQDLCDSSINDDPTEGFENNSDDEYPDESEIEKAKAGMADDQKRALDIDSMNVETLLAIKPTDPVIIAPITSASLCQSDFRQWPAYRTYWFNGGKCYLLKPWWGSVFTTITYASCRSQYCQNIPCYWWYYGYRYRCVGNNWKYFNLWLYCPHSSTSLITRLRLRLHQCCECKRFAVPWISSDFTPK